MKRLKLISKKATILFLATLLPVNSIWPMTPVSATTDLAWGNGDVPSFQTLGEPEDYRNYSWGIPCKKQEVPYMSQPDSIGVYEDVCMNSLEWGEVSQIWRKDNFSSPKEIFRPKHATLGGILKARNDGNGAQTRIVPVQSSRDIYAIVGCHTLYCLEKYEQGADTIKREDGQHDLYDFDRSNPIRLQDSFGRDLIMDRLSISQNGKWAIASTNFTKTSGRDGRIVRINLETFDILSVSDGPSGRDMAISNDGRYGFYHTSSIGLNEMRVVDFSTCDASNLADNYEVVGGCQFTDLFPNIDNYGSFETNRLVPEFSSDGTTISLNLTVEQELQRVAMTAGGYEYSGLDYLALGDSFASGEGDADGYYESGTNVPVIDGILPEGEKCHISRRSYPYLIAQEMGISNSRFKSVACSGAEMEDISNRSLEYQGQKRRLEKFDDEVTINMKEKARSEFIPGRVAQIEFVEKYKPKIVTISIGGNDASFGEVIADCAITTIQCGFADPANPDTRYEKAVRVQQMIDELKDLYEEIHNVSEKTKIYVLGYSKIIKKDGECSSLFGFNGNEREFIDESFGYMNKIVEAAARQAGVEYLNVEDALGEARLCGSSEPKAANGFTLGDDLAPIEKINVRPIGNESYHPNHLGHRMVASQITSKMNFDSCLPNTFRCPEEGVEIPEIPSYFVDSSYEPPERRRPYTSIRLSDEDTYLIGQDGEIRQNHYYDPLSQTVLELHSEPRHLGTFQTDENGSLNASFTIPEDVPAGYHTLRLKGTLISSEEVEFDQTILVLGREGDRDNNGVPDEKQECIEAPIAVTDDVGKFLVPPCAELDASFTEVTPDPDDKQQGETPSLEETIAAARRAIRQFLEESEYYQRLPFADQQNLITLLERQATSRIANLITYCDQNPESTILTLNFLKVVIGCRKTEDGIQLSMSMYLGLFKILFSSMNLEGNVNE